AALLREHRVEVVVDVRSIPRSAFVPHFDREAPPAALAKIGIDYVHLGRELGGRSDDPACYEGGRVRYDRVAETRDERVAEALARQSRKVAFAGGPAGGAGRSHA
ncbi:MAG: DUF488 domain-containing protein, partial [Alphaproteobacteria bacterium]|nr:DUF488 domain-containing protein [Alphaproteobacteria bacterium]